MIVIVLSVVLSSPEAFARKKNVTYRTGILLNMHVDDTADLYYYPTTAYHLGSQWYFYTHPVATYREDYYLEVKLGDIVYIGRYSPSLFKTYRPSDFVVNDPVLVRFDRKYMYLLRPDNRELKVRLIKRVRVGGQPEAK